MAKLSEFGGANIFHISIQSWIPNVHVLNIQEMGGLMIDESRLYLLKEFKVN